MLGRFCLGVASGGGGSLCFLHLSASQVPFDLLHDNGTVQDLGNV